MRIEELMEQRIIPNEEAVEILKNAYYSGKHRDNPHARFVDTSRGKDFVLIQVPMSQIPMDEPEKGIVDATVNVKRAEQEMMNLNEFPPVLMNRNGAIIDGGHRVYVAHRKGLKSIPALVRIDFYKEGKSKGIYK